MKTSLLLAVPLAPLAAAVLALLSAAWRPAWSAAFALAGNALALLCLVALAGTDVDLQARWLQTGGLALGAGLRLDALSRYAALLVAAIALPVNCYALGYIKQEPGRGFFFAAMSFFVGAMLTLVLAGSLVLLFAAWEAVGLASFVLIGFRYRDTAAQSASQQAFLMTRAGDVLLLLGWLLASGIAGTDDIPQVLARMTSGEMPAGLPTLIALLMLGGAVGKSAQLPLVAWLPAAMVGPTPVSALLHSATMVAAGVYLVLRVFPLFAIAPGALAALLWIGAATALIAALVATAQTDLKRVLAWSTSSQLGEMFFALGLAGPIAAAFHLATQAAYKATLFLVAGAVEQTTGTRTLARLGALAPRLPLAAVAFIGGALALGGVPPFSGYWSDERILGAAVHTPAAALLVLALVLLAGVYIGRAAAAVFGAWPRVAPVAATAPAVSMRLGISVLAVAAVATGWILSGRLEGLLPFPAVREPGNAWRVAAVGCAVAGLVIGAGRVWAAGPVPALGRWPLVLERAIFGLTNAPARIAFALAQLTERLDRRLDAGARSVAAVVREAARGVAVIEAALAGAGRAIAQDALECAGVVDAAERQALARGVDRFATQFAVAGGLLARVQTGKLYLYTAGIFVWVVLAVIGGLILVL